MHITNISFVRELKLGKSKEVTLGLRIFDYSSLGLGNIVNTLGE